MCSSSVSAGAEIPEALGALRVGVVPAVACGGRCPGIGGCGCRGDETHGSTSSNGSARAPPVACRPAPSRRHDDGTADDRAIHHAPIDNTAIDDTPPRDRDVPARAADSRTVAAANGNSSAGPARDGSAANMPPTTHPHLLNEPRRIIDERARGHQGTGQGGVRQGERRKDGLDNPIDTGLAWMNLHSRMLTSHALVDERSVDRHRPTTSPASRDCP
jgi:hypothetical protein